MKIFDRFDINAAFVLDLVGRPNYWSAFSQVKADREEKKDVYGATFYPHPTGKMLALTEQTIQSSSASIPDGIRKDDMTR